MILFYCGFKLPINQNIRKDLLLHFSLSKFKLFSLIDANLSIDYLFLTKHPFQKHFLRVLSVFFLLQKVDFLLFGVISKFTYRFFIDL